MQNIHSTHSALLLLGREEPLDRPLVLEHDGVCQDDSEATVFELLLVVVPGPASRAALRQSLGLVPQVLVHVQRLLAERVFAHDALATGASPPLLLHAGCSRYLFVCWQVKCGLFLYAYSLQLGIDYRNRTLSNHESHLAGSTALFMYDHSSSSHTESKTMASAPPLASSPSALERVLSAAFREFCGGVQHAISLHRILLFFLNSRLICVSSAKVCVEALLGRQDHELRRKAHSVCCFCLPACSQCFVLNGLIFLGSIFFFDRAVIPVIHLFGEILQHSFAQGCVLPYCCEADGHA